MRAEKKVPRALAKSPPTALAVLLTAAFAVTAWHVLVTYTRTWDYNAIRLQRTFALAAGEAIYGGPRDGVVLDVIYGPMAALAYLPATAWREPATAVLAGQVLSWLWMMLPFVFMLGREHASRLSKVFAGLSFAWLVVDQRPLEYAAFTVHADAPALGTALLAWALLFSPGPDTGAPLTPALSPRRPGGEGARTGRLRRLGAGTSAEEKTGEAGAPPSPVRLGLAALFALLSISAKLMTLPLLAVLPLLVFLAYGAATLRRFLLALAAWGAALAAGAVLFFGPLENLVFNLWTVPSAHVGGETDWFGGLSRLAFEGASGLGLLLLALLLCRFGRGRPSREPASSLGFVALAMLPLSLLALFKRGGDINALAYVCYFASAGAVLSLLRLEGATAAADRRSGLWALRSFPALLAALVLLFQEPAALTTWREPPRLEQVPHQLAFRYLQEHPGELYFPRLTLAHLLAEGELYHQATGLADRRISGFPLDERHLWAHLPPHPAGVAYRRNGFESIHAYLGLEHFEDADELEALPGFLVLRPKEQTPPPGGPEFGVAEGL